MLFYILQAPSALPVVDMVESHMAQKAQSIVGTEVRPTIFYFILSSEINAYQKQIKVIPITSEMI